MPVKNQKPKECATLLQQGWTCVDVRTVEEFEAGHPAGAFNVPVMNRGAAGIVPNPEFVAVVLDREERLWFSWSARPRSGVVLLARGSALSRIVREMRLSHTAPA